jgi:flagellar FliJ protein
MARFVFKLHAVARQRELVEQQKQRVMATLRMQMGALETRLRQMDGQMRVVDDDLRRNRLTGPVDVSFLIAHRRYVLATQRQAMELAQQMAALQRQIDQARIELAEAAKNRKAIEKLREKQFGRWKAEQDRKEMADLDEVGQQMALTAGDGN